MNADGTGQSAFSPLSAFHSPATHHLSIFFSSEDVFIFWLQTTRVQFLFLGADSQQVAHWEAMKDSAGLQRQGQGNWEATNGTRQSPSRKTTIKKNPYPFIPTGMKRGQETQARLLQSILLNGVPDYIWLVVKWLWWFPDLVRALKCTLKGCSKIRASLGWIYFSEWIINSIIIEGIGCIF